jgi:hypothetical protein
MRLSTVLLVCGLVAVSSQPSHAAEATDVLDAIDGDDLFDAHIELTYRGQIKTAKITREDVRADFLGPDGKRGAAVDVVEFLYFEHSHQVIPRLRIGIFQDVELFISLPYTLLEQRMGFQHPRNGNGKDPSKQGYSSFVRDMCTYAHPDARPQACDSTYPSGNRTTLSGNNGSWPVNHDVTFGDDGRPYPGEYNGNDTDWDLDTDRREAYLPRFSSIRGAVAYSMGSGFFLFPKGMGDAELGFAFSPFSFARFNDQRDSAMPTVRLEAKYQVPSGPLDTPGPFRKRCTAEERRSRRDCREQLGGSAEDFDPGGTGSGLHRLSAGFAISKRLKLFDPFVGASYTLGIPQYYKRDAPERDWLMNYKGQVDMGFWQNQLMAMGGVEVAPLYAVPDVEEVVNLRMVLGGTATFFARHRGPSEMSDVLHKWSYVDNYVQVLGRLGLLLSVPFVTFRALLEAGHETPHLLTGEAPGYDNDGDGLEAQEVNRFYNPVLDTPGRRVKVSESVLVNGSISLAITF